MYEARLTIGQILVGQANGQISCLYSPEHSLNGAKLLANKSVIKRATIESVASAELQPQIITPHALPMFRDGEGGTSVKRKREKERMDPRKSKRPELPVTGPGKGGRVGASATQHVVQNLFRDTTRDQDVSVTPFLMFLMPFGFFFKKKEKSRSFVRHRGVSGFFFLQFF